MEEAQAAGATVKRCAEQLGLSTRTLERWRRSGEEGDQRRGPNTVPRNKLSEHEERRLLKTVTSPEFRDLSPRQVIVALAERGEYIASESTAYRALAKRGMAQHREETKPRESRRPAELIAAAPNEVYSWDITYLPSQIRGQYFYLYMVTDIYSRRIVRARVYEAESESYAQELFREVQQREGISAGQVTLHSDNGSVMKGATLKATFETLGIARSFSRPRVSNDNPYSESLFGTMKTRVEYPKRPFSSLESAQEWVTRFVAWYNNEHRHSALNWVTPAARHAGADVALLRRREATYLAARRRHPERWSGNIRNCSPAPPATLNPSNKKSAARRTGQAA